MDLSNIDVDKIKEPLEEQVESMKEYDNDVENTNKL